MVFSLHPREFRSLVKTPDRKTDPRSVTIVVGMPYRATQWSTKALATVWASTLCSGMSSTHDVYLSTMDRMYE